MNHAERIAEIDAIRESIELLDSMTVAVRAVIARRRLDIVECDLRRLDAWVDRASVLQAEGLEREANGVRRAIKLSARRIAGVQHEEESAAFTHLTGMIREVSCPLIARLSALIDEIELNAGPPIVIARAPEPPQPVVSSPAGSCFPWIIAGAAAIVTVVCLMSR